MKANERIIVAQLIYLLIDRGEYVSDQVELLCKLDSKFQAELDVWDEMRAEDDAIELELDRLMTERYGGDWATTEAPHTEVYAEILQSRGEI